MKIKLYTLCFWVQGDRILLGMKKRGFGVGRWNGFGGKVKEGETIEAAAKRELQEEVGLSAGHLDPRGKLLFSFDGKDEALEVHVFSLSDVTGEPKESEEMRPQWFFVSEIPFQDMWPDDPYWLGLFLQGKKFEGEFHFKDQNTVDHYTINVV